MIVSLLVPGISQAGERWESLLLVPGTTLCESVHTVCVLSCWFKSVLCCPLSSAKTVEANRSRPSNDVLPVCSESPVDLDWVLLWSFLYTSKQGELFSTSYPSFTLSLYFNLTGVARAHSNASRAPWASDCCDVFGSIVGILSSHVVCSVLAVLSLANVSPGFNVSLLMALLSTGWIPDDLNALITVRGL